MWYIVVIMVSAAGQPTSMPKVGGFDSLSQCSAALSSFVEDAADSDMSIAKVGCEKD
jgi:hypothetical protein